jgi:hypothetical protein
LGRSLHLSDHVISREREREKKKRKEEEEEEGLFKAT